MGVYTRALKDERLCDDADQASKTMVSTKAGLRLRKDSFSLLVLDNTVEGDAVLVSLYEYVRPTTGGEIL